LQSAKESSPQALSKAPSPLRCAGAVHIASGATPRVGSPLWAKTSAAVFDSGSTTPHTARVVLRLGKWLVVLSLVLMIGGHWALLQSAAWIGMTAKFSQKETVAVALEKTFSGKYPCKLCKFVKAGKATEHKQELEKLEAKFEFTLVAGTCGVFPPRPFWHFTPQTEYVDARVDAPRPPPPRAA